MQKYIEDNQTCKVCGRELAPIYENTGYNEPDPTHYEIVGYKLCENCIEE